MDALDQRARLVEARFSRREGRVEVQVAVDQRRRHEAAARIDRRAVDAEVRPDLRPAAVLGG
jgi:hypothetical protein